MYQVRRIVRFTIGQSRRSGASVLKANKNNEDVARNADVENIEEFGGASND